MENENAQVETPGKKKLRFAPNPSTSSSAENEEKKPKSLKIRKSRNLRNQEPLPPISPNMNDSRPGPSNTTPAPSHSSSSDRMASANAGKTPRRGGVSSQRTVIVIAAFLVVGFIFVAAGILVLLTEHHFAFKTAGGSFITVGLLSIVWCIFLQQKNFKRLVHELEKDIYFGNIMGNHVIRRLLSYDSD